MKPLLFISLFFVLIASCKKDEFETGSGTRLAFSQDTLVFDTVFTSVGSATQIFSVYNRNNKAIKISSLYIAGGPTSNFRLNVDGVSGKSFSNVEIGANDSLFIFAEVTVDPNNTNNPLIVTDSIIFITNGNMQDVDLVAWGQDCYFHRPPPNSPNGSLFLLNCNDIWTNDKPHVVYGYALVDSACSLTINEGTNVHFHPGSGLIVLTAGQLIVNGTAQNNVVFQGDRLGQAYQDIPGQWDRIFLSNANVRSNVISPGPKPSTIKYAVIKNGNIGLQVDTVFSPGSITLTLENTIVKNMSTHALLLEGSTVRAYNCVFANCGSQNANLRYGGDFKFYHCTFANFWSNGNRRSPVLSLNNYTNIARPLDAYFGNCIVYGTNDTELDLDSFPTTGQFNFYFDYSLLKVENTFPTSNTSHYSNIIRATGSSNNPLFQDTENNNYQLDSLNSPAIDRGDAAILLANPAILNFDLNGTPRPQRSAPDLGAYERE